MNVIHFLATAQGTLLSTIELIIVIVASVLLVALIALNIIIHRIYKKTQDRTLCTQQLQLKREELLRRLDEMKGGNFASDEEEEEEEIETEEELQEDEDSADDEEEPERPMPLFKAESEDDEEGDEEGDEDDSFGYGADQLAVADMSMEMRSRLGFEGAEYEDKTYFVRYSYGFEAKLRAADEEIKARYCEFADEIGLYKGLKIKKSYRQQRIYKGRKTLGLILFRGKTLCIALALNPADYADTKYRGIDKSDKKRFAATPMLFRITSARKLEYAKYLLVQLADANTIVMNDKPVKGEYDLKQLSVYQLFEANLLRISVLGEVGVMTAEEAEHAEVAAVAEVEETEAPAEAPVEESPAEEAPAEEAPTEEAPAEEAPSEE